jgi:6-pyruvoyltetrahydropterin/6-carboxytetrahydropterin synthase
MNASLWIDVSFSAAHFLPCVPAGHKCRRPHGHNYRLRAWVTGPVSRSTTHGAPEGMVVDFDWVRGAVEEVVAQLDHHDLNTVIDNPTAELLAKWILEKLPTAIGKIELREVEWAGVVLTREDLHG